MQKTQITSQIPSSHDEYFQGGDVQRINKYDIKNVVCKECKWKLDAGRREVSCEVCGRGYKFQVQDVRETDEYIEIGNLRIDKRVL